MQVEKRGKDLVYDGMSKETAFDETINPHNPVPSFVWMHISVEKFASFSPASVNTGGVDM